MNAPQVKLLFDGPITIATGRSRKETDWKPKQLLWSDFIAGLSCTQRTQETQAEYFAFPKQVQDEIKDVGGFVFGHLKGRRKIEALKWCCGLSLDIDFAPKDFWDDWLLRNEFAACLYSTHKHTPDNPRLRLLMPSSRNMQPDEVQACGRKIADRAGREYFDDSTFEPYRLMYYPSTSKDAQYVFEYQDGPWLNVDTLLASYGPNDAWRDHANWTESSRTQQQRQAAAVKLGDPDAKPGLVGAFCRTYNIPAAISQFLPEAYVEAGPNRWTYAKGSTAGGAVEYEGGKFLYSHHSTDPISGMLVNAFDLVRVHRFAGLDDNVREGTPSNQIPSFVAMTYLAVKDDAVKITLAADRRAKTIDDFTDDNWEKALEVDKNGNPRPTPQNILLILNHDPLIKNTLTEDTFAHKLMVSGKLPWRQEGELHSYSDKDDSCLRNYFHTYHKISGRAVIQDALNQYLLEHSVHPVRDYLKELKWDGVRRVDTLFIDYLGSEDNDYTRAVTRKMLVAAVARVMKPGVKFDNVLILVGEQGIGKSFMLGKLGGKWFSDSIDQFSGKEAYEALQGVWIVELGELAAMRRTEVEQVKHFLSKQHDRFRVPYDRNTSDFPRQCVFFGSTNRDDFLNDPSGNRRFWPVKTQRQEPTKKVFAEFPQEVDQVWAEAKVLYTEGETLFLDTRLLAMAVEAQEEHTDESEKTGMVLAFLDKKLPDNWKDKDVYARREWLRNDFGTAEIGTLVRDKVCILEIWCELFNGDSRNLNILMRNEIRDILIRAKNWKLYDRGSRGRLWCGDIYGLQTVFARIQKPGYK